MTRCAFVLTMLGAICVFALCGCRSEGCKTDNDCKGDRICEKGSCTDRPAPPRPAPATQAAVTAAFSSEPHASNDGSDARRPFLSPSDADFVDTRGGWGWSDRCWNNIKIRKYGWAKAECDRALAMNPASPSPRASILYNLGLIEQGSGNVAGARVHFEASLALREHPEVRAALEALPGAAPSSAPPKQIACGGATCSEVCCATFDKPYCATDASRCERAANGEGIFYECDGPEDCGAGRVCCWIVLDRTSSSSCVERPKCRGIDHHPRYEVDTPRVSLCHTAADCSEGKTCQVTAQSPVSLSFPVCK